MNNDDNRREQAIKNAIASARMEGFEITPENERDIRRAVNGEISTKDLIAEIMTRHESKRKEN